MSGRHTGTADLPLHQGKAPQWLMKRMVMLSRGITQIIVDEYGPDELLRRVSNPLWFQAFSCVLGFDWHSSGTTTTTCGALKSALTPETHGIYIAGGKGVKSIATPEEIASANLDPAVSGILTRASRMSAKVDSACVQDGFSLYHHTFFFTEDGKWAVVQQGMNPHLKMARRYHWLSEGVHSFVDEPHSGICCDATLDAVLDLTSRENESVRKCSIDLIKDHPIHIRKYLTRRGFQSSLSDFRDDRETVYLIMPERHEILEPIDISDRGFQVLKKLYELNPSSYEEVVSYRGAGAKLLRALALVSNLIYGCGISWKDTAIYSFAHGGKDGIPFPVDRKTYDTTIQTIYSAIQDARIDKKEKTLALKRLSAWVDNYR